MTLIFAIAAGLGVVATVEDLRRRTLPNWLTVGGLALCLGCSAAGGWHGFFRALAGATAGFAIFLPVHWLRGMGGGDVKLMAAFGALLGPSGALEAAVIAAIFGGAITAAVLMGKPRTAAIPYAPAIVLGSWFALLGGGS